MRYQTEAVGETTWLLGELPSSGSVTIILYKLSDSSTPALDSSSCTEIGSTGIYKWATTNITTPETTKTEYMYVMTDGALSYFGKIVVGGYPDEIDEIQGKLPDGEIAGSSDKTSLESKHGTGSWKTATGFAKPGDVKCGGGGGGAIIERPDIWKPEEKLKLIEDIKKIYKMINELSSLQSVGLQNVKKDIRGLRDSLLKVIREEVTVLVSIKKAIAQLPKSVSSSAFTDSINLLISKWDSIQKTILKSSDLTVLDKKLDDITKIMAKSLPNELLEELVLENGS